MKRPNKLDWLIYKIFRWWWNPILVGNAELTRNLILLINEWSVRHLIVENKNEEKEKD